MRQYFVRIYYISTDNGAGTSIPTLTRLDFTGTGWTTTPLVEGIEEFNIEYGIDWHGATLADPKGILEGAGNQIRHISIKTPDDLFRPEIRAYIQRARKVALAESKKLGDAPPKKPKGVVSTVKAIYAKKRRPK